MANIGYYESSLATYNNDKKGFIVDPGDNGKKINKYLIENEIELTAILITHGHIDHIGAVDYLYNIYKCPIIAHEETIEMMRNPQLNLSSYISKRLTYPKCLTTARVTSMY